jgi:hypothetical protein
MTTFRNVARQRRGRCGVSSCISPVASKDYQTMIKMARVKNIIKLTMLLDDFYKKISIKGKGA